MRENKRHTLCNYTESAVLVEEKEDFVGFGVGNTVSYKQWSVERARQKFREDLGG